MRELANIKIQAFKYLLPNMQMPSMKQLKHIIIECLGVQEKKKLTEKVFIHLEEIPPFITSWIKIGSMEFKCSLQADYKEDVFYLIIEYSYYE